MRMLRIRQSKLLGPNHAPRVNVSRNAFFSSCSSRALNKKHSLDVDIVAEYKSKCGLSWSVLLSTTNTRHYSFPKHFLVLFLHVNCVTSLRKLLKGKSDVYK